MRLRLTTGARADLVSILDYGRRTFGDSQARKYQDRLRQAFGTLLDHPVIGYKIRVGTTECRCFNIARHRLFYRVDDDQVLILAILHESSLPRLQDSSGGAA